MSILFRRLIRFDIIAQNSYCSGDGRETHFVELPMRITNHVSFLCTVLSVLMSNFDIFFTLLISPPWNGKYPNYPLGGWSVTCLAFVCVSAVTFRWRVVELVELLLRPVAWNLDPYHLRHYWNFVHENHPTWRSRKKWIHGGCMFFFLPSLRFVFIFRFGSFFFLNSFDQLLIFV